MEMRYVAYAEHAANGRGRFSEFVRLFESHGFEVRSYSADTISGLPEFLQNAVAIWVPGDTFLQTNELVALLRKTVSEGKRFIVDIEPNQADLINKFLDPYGIEGTTVGLVSAEPGTEHPAVIRIARERSPLAFRDELILKDIDIVVLQQARVLRYGGDAVPVLIVPTQDVELIDRATDLPELTSPQLTCIARGGEEELLNVLAVSAGLFHDPYVGLFGAAFPGISPNRQLAENVIKWLTADADEVSPLASKAFQLLDRIERSLVETICIVLGFKSASWWEDYIPKAVRQKCGSRRRTDGDAIPASAYLDLLDFRTIFFANEKFFLSELGPQAGLNILAESVTRLNILRRLVMHPTKRLLGSIHIGSEDVGELESHLREAARLLAIARDLRRRRKEDC